MCILNFELALHRVYLYIYMYHWSSLTLGSAFFVPVVVRTGSISLTSSSGGIPFGGLCVPQACSAEMLSSSTLRCGATDHDLDHLWSVFIGV